MAAEEHKNQFLAIVAHELRNPLAPIRNLVEVIRRADGRGEVIEPCLEMMERQLGQMTRLINDLFDMNRVSRGELELRPQEVELGSVLRNAVSSAGAAIEAASCTLTVELPSHPVHVRADEGRLAQVFGNLLTNARKFTPAGGRIAVAAQREGSDVVVKVTDSGIGMSPELLPRVFDPFVQGDTTVEGTARGLGIGLALVKQLVQKHGGSVQAFSDGVGRGSEFVVRLPALPEEGLTASARMPTGAAATVPARRVLVVDDNHDAADSPRRPA